MPAFELLCYWTESALVTVEADTPEEAIEKMVNHNALPDGSYVPDSFTAELTNPDEGEDENGS